MKHRLIAVAIAGISISGCAPSEPRSKQYFDAHVDEARQVLADCQAGSARGEECENAERAVIRADARARSKRFLGDGKAYTPRD